MSEKTEPSSFEASILPNGSCEVIARCFQNAQLVFCRWKGGVICSSKVDIIPKKAFEEATRVALEKFGLVAGSKVIARPRKCTRAETMAGAIRNAKRNQLPDN